MIWCDPLDTLLVIILTETHRGCVAQYDCFGLTSVLTESLKGFEDSLIILFTFSLKTFPLNLKLFAISSLSTSFIAEAWNIKFFKFLCLRNFISIPFFIVHFLRLVLIPLSFITPYVSSACVEMHVALG